METITPTSITMAFGMHPSRVQKWMAEYEMPFQYRSPAKRQRSVDLEVFRQWVSESDPKIFAGIPRSRLAKVLIDDAVIDAIAALIPHRGRECKLVQTSPTRREFGTIKAAAEGCFMSYSALMNSRVKAIKSGATHFKSCGYVFEIGGKGHA